MGSVTAVPEVDRKTAAIAVYSGHHPAAGGNTLFILGPCKTGTETFTGNVSGNQYNSPPGTGLIDAPLGIHAAGNRIRQALYEGCQHQYQGSKRPNHIRQSGLRMGLKKTGKGFGIILCLSKQGKLFIHLADFWIIEPGL
jgi:hypothetical protein